MLDLPDWLYEYLMMLPKDEVIEIMANALDRMQEYNGRTITYCVVSSISGTTCEETDDAGYRYSLPEVK